MLLQKVILLYKSAITPVLVLVTVSRITTDDVVRLPDDLSMFLKLLTSNDLLLKLLFWERCLQNPLLLLLLLLELLKVLTEVQLVVLFKPTIVPFLAVLAASRILANIVKLSRRAQDDNTDVNISRNFLFRNA